MFKPKFNIDDLIKVPGGELINGSNIPALSISTDTRTITQEDAYLAICGAVFDGHNFVKNAFDSGAKLAIIDKKHKDIVSQVDGCFLIVEDTLNAYLQIAKFHKDNQKVKILAVTGSSGKTTTKEILYAVFNSKFKTNKSIKNHNNEIGLCQTLLAIEPDTKYCIVEMGMRGLGEIDLLAKYATPDCAIITNAGSAHIGILGSLENIAKAKCEISNYLKDDALLVAHNNELIKNNLASGNYEKIFYDLNDVKILEQSENKGRFIYKNEEYVLPDGADFNILNSLAVINIALKEGFSSEEINRGFQEFKNIEYRNEVTKLSCGAIVISDCYNANPDSTKVSLKHIAQTYKDKKIVVVFGDMFELGEFEENYHKEIGELINSLNVNYFVSVGNLAKITAREVNNIPKKICKDVNEAAEFLSEFMEEDTLVFLKASRGMHFEKILEMIKGK